MSSEDIYNLLLAKNPISALYLKRYVKFITLCITHNQTLSKEAYTEKHHIIPTSLYKEYRSFRKHGWNLATLTARQHLIAHVLLAKAFDTRGLWYAVNMMFASNDRLHGRIYNSRLFELSRQNNSRKIISMVA